MATERRSLVKPSDVQEGSRIRRRHGAARTVVVVDVGDGFVVVRNHRRNLVRISTRELYQYAPVKVGGAGTNEARH